VDGIIFTMKILKSQQLQGGFADSIGAAGVEVSLLRYGLFLLCHRPIDFGGAHQKNLGKAGEVATGFHQIHSSDDIGAEGQLPVLPGVPHTADSRQVEEKVGLAISHRFLEEGKVVEVDLVELNLIEAGG